jgi:hypothetical protein
VSYNLNNQEEWYDELVKTYGTMLTDDLIAMEAGYRATIRVLELRGEPLSRITATQVRLNAISQVINGRLTG